MSSKVRSIHYNQNSTSLTYEDSYNVKSGNTDSSTEDYNSIEIYNMLVSEDSKKYLNINSKYLEQYKENHRSENYFNLKSCVTVVYSSRPGMGKTYRIQKMLKELNKTNPLNFFLSGDFNINESFKDFKKIDEHNKEKQAIQIK